MNEGTQRAAMLAAVAILSGGGSTLVTGKLGEAAQERRVTEVEAQSSIDLIRAREEERKKMRLELREELGRELAVESRLTTAEQRYWRNVERIEKLEKNHKE